MTDQAPGSPGMPAAGDPATAPAVASGTATGAAEGEPARLTRVLVVGSGLIGASIGLALRETGIDVALEDTSAGRLALAVEMGAGRPREAEERFDLAVVAVPPDAVGPELLRLQKLGIARSYTDVASAKAEPLAKAQTLGVDLSSYVGGHPVAGRERSGPAAARGDLFVGRPWVVTATSHASQAAVADVAALATACGASVVHMSADEHDAALATVSHLPHVVASLLAGQLVQAADATVRLGGTGLHDTTRVAAGDARLWTQILVANAGHLAAALAAFAAAAERTAADLERIAQGDADAVDALTRTLQAGVAGRARVPLKRGETAGFTTVPIMVRDAPGELAALLRSLADAGINVEDVHVEHEPGRAVGIVEIEVRDDAAPALVSAAREAGWQIAP